jgi:hypothetical protein
MDRYFYFNFLNNYFALGLPNLNEGFLFYVIIIALPPCNNYILVLISKYILYK